VWRSVCCVPDVLVIRRSLLVKTSPLCAFMDREKVTLLLGIVRLT
jgi:hypothetical protein